MYYSLWLIFSKCAFVTLIGPYWLSFNMRLPFRKVILNSSTLVVISFDISTAKIFWKINILNLLYAKWTAIVRSSQKLLIFWQYSPLVKVDCTLSWFLIGQFLTLSPFHWLKVSPLSSLWYHLNFSYQQEP